MAAGRRRRLERDAVSLLEAIAHHAAVALENARLFDETASTGWSQLAAIDVEQRRFRDAESLLEQSLPFTVDRDIPICEQWQTGVRSRLQFERGRWEAGLEDARTVLDGGTEGDNVGLGNVDARLRHRWC